MKVPGIRGVYAATLFLIVEVGIAIPTYIIWNTVCPRIFGLPEMTFREILLLSLLISFLFKGPLMTFLLDSCEIPGKSVKQNTRRKS